MLNIILYKSVFREHHLFNRHYQWKCFTLCHISFFLCALSCPLSNLGSQGKCPLCWWCQTSESISWKLHQRCSKWSGSGSMMEKQVPHYSPQLWLLVLVYSSTPWMILHNLSRFLGHILRTHWPQSVVLNVKYFLFLSTLAVFLFLVSSVTQMKSFLCLIKTQSVSLWSGGCALMVLPEWLQIHWDFYTIRTDVLFLALCKKSICHFGYDL